MLTSEDVGKWNTLVYFTKPQSLNSAYYNQRLKGGHSRRRLCPQAADYKDYVFRMTDYQTEDDFRVRLKDYPYLAAVYVFFDRFHTKAGTFIRKDLTNLIKITEDALCDSLRIDDRGFGDVFAHKIGFSGPPRFFICFKAYKESPSFGAIYKELGSLYGSLVSADRLRGASGIHGDRGSGQFVLPHEEPGRRRETISNLDGDPTPKDGLSVVPF